MPCINSPHTAAKPGLYISLQASNLPVCPLLSAEVPSQGLLTSLLCFPGISQGDFLPDLNSARRVYELLPVVLGHVKVKAMNKLGS